MVESLPMDKDHHPEHWRCRSISLPSPHCQALQCISVIAAGLDDLTSDKITCLLTGY